MSDVLGAPTGARRRGAVLCLLALTVVLLTPATVARAGTEGACPDGAGVTVVVDFAGFRDEVLVRCAPAPVDSGYDALTKAGFDWTPTQRQPGFLCRIEGLPADDPCATTPPADAYWGYWRAEHGGTWTYSDRGPATTSPPPGPVEGWRFSTGDDAPPRMAPPAAAPAPSPAPSPTSSASPSPAPSQTPTATAAPPSSPTPAPPPASTSAGSPHPSAAATPAPTAAPGDTASTSPSPDTTTSPSPTATPEETSHTPTASPDPTSPPAAPTPRPTALAASAPADGGGPPVGTLVGLALLAAVGGAAGLVARRRRAP
jgi:hypothetical protein